MERNKNKDIHLLCRAAAYVAMALFVLLAFSAGAHILRADAYLLGIRDMNLFDLLLSQVANTLIVLSLTSVLSENFGQIYWEDVKQMKLVEPFFGCFIGLTVYLLTAVIFSIVCYVCSFFCGLLVSFAFSAVLLVALTFKMISIYFGREPLKQTLYLQYRIQSIWGRGAYPSLPVLKALAGEYSGRPGTAAQQRMLRQLADSIRTLESLSPQDGARYWNDRKASAAQWLKQVDGKLVEYTKNAIAANAREAVLENTGLLLDAENFDGLHDLVDPLLAWDASVCCDLLQRMSGASEAIAPYEYGKLIYTRDRVLAQLIRESSEADAVSTLLYSYGHWFNWKPEHIEDIERLAGQLTALRAQRMQQPERRGELQSRIAAAEADIMEDLKQCSPDELRDHDVPARLAHLLYREGNYQQAAWCLDIIVHNYQNETALAAGGGILAAANVMAMETAEEFTYSYTTQEEQSYLDRILEMDEEIGVLPPACKSALQKMPHTTIYTHAAYEKALAGSAGEEP